ncbi:MAG: CBS domain-containing protein [Candidatus Bathyarchaeia archaeon]
MVENESKFDVKAKDAMSSPVITIKESENIVKVAKLMDKHGIGCIVVVDKKGNPIGMITERDVIERVVAKSLAPGRTKVSKVMSKPIAAIDPNTSMMEAAKKMKKMNIRRLAVMESGKLVGILTSKDIAYIAPFLVDVASERLSAPRRTLSKMSGLTGYCDRCGTWSDSLTEHEGTFLCEDCLVDLEEEEKTF